MEAIPQLRFPLPRCVKLTKQRLANRVSDPVPAMEAVSSLAVGFLGARGGIVWFLYRLPSQPTGHTVGSRGRLLTVLQSRSWPSVERGFVLLLGNRIGVNQIPFSP